MSTLPAELLQLVLSNLEWPFELHAISLVSRWFADCASIELARTLPIPAAATDLDRLYLWIQRLLRTDQGHLRDAVGTIVLDDIVRPLRPQIPAPGHFGEVKRERYADVEVVNVPQQRPHKVFFALQALLPQLHNIRVVNLRRPVADFPLDALDTPAASKLFGSKRLGRGRDALRIALSTGEPSQSSTVEAPGLNIWKQLINPETKPYISELFLNCTPRLEACIPAANLLRSVTTLALHDIDCRSPGAVPGETAWTPVLAACSYTLRNFCLVRVLGFATLVAFHSDRADAPSTATFFPRLTNFEAFKLVLRGPDSQALADFFERHSPTLEVLAIGVRCDLGNALQPAAHFIRTSYLTDPHVFSALRIMRLENADFLRRWTTPLAELPMLPIGGSAVLDLYRRDTALCVERFVRARPLLHDVTFFDLPEEPNAADLRREIASRPGGRSLIGAERVERFNAAVPAEPKNEREYLWSAWVFYELLFKGLTLERSGFRPFLPKRIESPNPAFASTLH